MTRNPDHTKTCQRTRDDRAFLRIRPARENDSQRWAAKHEDFYGAAVALARLVGFEFEDG